MLRKYLQPLLLLLAACFLVSCSSNTRLDYSLSTDFSLYKYYQIRLADVEEIYTFFDSRQFIESRLLAKDLLKAVDAQKADFIVELSINYIGENSSMSLGLGVGSSQRAGDGAVGVGVSSGMPLGVKPVAYVRIDILDARSGKLLWRNAEEVRYKGEVEKKQNIYEAIEKILEDFPPKPK